MKKNESIAEKIKKDMIGVILTDTIYGVAASALSKEAVERAYKILKRNLQKPFIVLISSMKDLSLFGIKLDCDARKILDSLWPGKISVVLPTLSKKFQYLHRGTKTLAFRWPKDANLAKILKETGPLISTSANPEGAKPSETAAEAKKYFGDSIDFYIDGGKMKSLPSTLIEIKEGKIRVLRRGAGKLSLIKI